MTHLDCGDSFSHSNFRHKDFSNHWTNTVTLHLGGITDKSVIYKAFKHPCTYKAGVKWAALDILYIGISNWEKLAAHTAE